MSPANGHAQKDRTTTSAPPPAMLTPSVVRFPTERIKELVAALVVELSEGRAKRYRPLFAEN
jgi:hypothetical protein